MLLSRGVLPVNWMGLVTSELREHKKRLIVMGSTVALSVAMIVALCTVVVYWQKAVEREVDALGANLLILPMNATVSDYYRADLEAGEIPEEYVTLLATSTLRGLDNVSPKLSLPVKLRGEECILTGVLPSQEFAAKAAWAGAGIFSRPNGCGVVSDALGLTGKPPPPSRVIETLQADEALIGADVASKLNLAKDEVIDLGGRAFRVVGILPPTGTIDDTRLFAHLHTVQEIGNKGRMVNVIEIVGCCKEISQGLVAKLNGLLPEARVVTISQLVDTQVQTTNIMRTVSYFLGGLLAVMGGLVVGKEMYSNVQERKGEIGILLSLGMSSKGVVALFLGKAVAIGLIGGALGFLVGSLSAVIIGPLVTGIPILPIWDMLFYCLSIPLVISVVGAYFPARRASRLDPCVVFGEGR